MSDRNTAPNPGPFGFGYCPTCGGCIVARERREIGGMSRCLHGHDTPNEAVATTPGARRVERPVVTERNGLRATA